MNMQKTGVIVIVLLVFFLIIYSLMPPKSIEDLSGWSTDREYYKKIIIEITVTDSSGICNSKKVEVEDKQTIGEILVHLNEYEFKNIFKIGTYNVLDKTIYDISLFTTDNKMRKITIIADYIIIDNKEYKIINKPTKLVPIKQFG